MAELEKNKGFSLRKNKASRRLGITAAKEISSPLGAPSPYAQEAYLKGTASVPRVIPRERTKIGATSDLVKKRYSVRYAQGPDLNGKDVPPIPSLPSLGSQSTQQPSNGESNSLQTQGIDLKALRDPSLGAEDYVTKVLSVSSENDIQDYQKSLIRVKSRTSTDLQHNVYQNRTQFIKISKEAEKLKGEMQTLRGLMSDLTTTLGQASLSTPYNNGRRSPTSDDNATYARKKSNRSSVANLEAMRNTQLQALWKNIEGSQKFLPAIPGRHIVQESGHWVELDAATWKPRRPVHIVLINDHLLIASKKRKRMDPNASLSPESAGQKAPTKLVAERCWQLQDIDIIDLSSSTKDSKGPSRDLEEIVNAITIRHGQESFTYRGDRSGSSEKANLLLAFKRTMDELRRSEKAEVDQMNNKSKETVNYLAARDPAISSSPGLLRSLSKAKERPAEVLIDVDGKQRNFRWVEGQIDELDIEIALQRFEEAVCHVEQLRKLAKGLKKNTVVQDLITVRVDERARNLADLITAGLTATHAFLTPTQIHTSHLSRLLYTPLARATYLSARTGIIHVRARQAIFEGDLLKHIMQLSYIYFSLIKNTVSVYQQCFPPIMMSSVVVWAKERLDEFNVELKRGVESVEKGGEVWKECLDVAKGDGGAGMMVEVGLDFRGLVGKGLEATDEQQIEEAKT